MTRYQYDASGDLTGETLADGSQLSWTYQTLSTSGGPYDALVESVDELGHQTWYTNDSTTGDVLAVEQVVGWSRGHRPWTPSRSIPTRPPRLLSPTRPAGWSRPR